MHQYIENMEYKLLKKAYKIDFNKIEEGYLASEVMCVADSRSKAKSVLLKKIRWEDWKTKYDNEDITYLNIPVIRYPEADQYEFEGQCLSISKIDDILIGRVRSKDLNDILENELITHCYIKKHGSYYKPNHCGYTERIIDAGIYDKQDAVDCARSCRDLIIIPIDIKEHNKIFFDKISELEAKIL